MTHPLLPKHFQQHVLNWFNKHGRKNLPWQQKKSPYHVWLSEIMLQQTQVTTVTPYFQRFIKQFPNLSSLAAAQLDEVLNLWAGLGYYARARNLLRCAQMLEQKYAGKFPQNLIQLQTLPGIGRSTAGAILSLGFDQAAAILDGNVKRVLTRFHAIAGWPGLSAVNKKLWELAERYTPIQQTAAYTQAMMDLGALICTRTQPKCDQCPLQTHCLAYNTGNPAHFPSPKPSKKLPIRSIQMLILVNQQQEILLEKRPPTGIWGGLWSLPECPSDADAKNFSKKHYYCETEKVRQAMQMRHTFSHFHLDIQAVVMQVNKWHPPLMESDRIVWYNVQQLQKKGLAAPIKKLIQQLNNSTYTHSNGIFGKAPRK
ncbi:A / G specific adenine glycosylase [Candidatus Rickettsiella viridis]|uniref:Adenine DNA glycosylase n=1 Tax=Candidatus Rickettsiella viridis TaxID=676208 RepID=A0A2Z5UVD0_9COXI|nr:A/G-specific adenine glycosylase [Candidatus Rickettsiella viridis]BBB14910.1 A / G specific adenine glycosylase [Candidatus Rickettsiella viridis]